MPDHLDDAVVAMESYEVKPDHLLLRIPSVASYHVSHGRQIVVDAPRTSNEHDVRVFLLGTCFGALLHQRGLLVLHASGIGSDHGAAVFAGGSGAGKSTLLAELMRRGRKMMVDDVCALTFDESAEPIVMPSYPRSRMWSDAAAQLAIDVAGLPRTRAHMDKYERQVPEQFWDRVAPVRRIYHLAGSNGDALSLSAVEPLAVIRTVLDNTYRKTLLDGLGMRRHHFDLASAVARAVPVRCVIRPTDGFRLAELADLILSDLEEGRVP